ncbi:phosphodiester glycosidase family protein [Shimia biformata]|uniref:phosphodiester glycosidase family protein n=1 Tax=Shimia biformata TaxID=1294299 RepID=UPI00194EADAE|nr:phosphodiester glycosidase family protein [Shimia biformata]
MRAALALLLALVAAPVAAVECRNIRFDDTPYTICEAAARSDDIRLFLKDDTGKVFGQFSAIRNSLGDGETLVMAMNGGMYHADRSPVGLYRDQHGEAQRLVTTDGPGNFGLLPNGVFCIRANRADVIETRVFDRRNPSCTFATQSGPMLVIDGKLHPRFLPDSTSRYIRNGVGTSADGQSVVFAISRQPVTFHQFGRLFRDGLKLPSALYFDGKVSRLYAPSVNRDDPGFRLGPIVGIVSTN